MKKMNFRSICGLLLALALLLGLLGCSAAEVQSAAKTAGEIMEVVSQLSEQEPPAPAEPAKEEAEPEQPSVQEEQPPEQPEQAPSDEPAQTPEEAEKPQAEEPNLELPGQPLEPTEPETPSKEEEPPIDEDGEYTEKDDVALYLHTYGRLPKNFMTKGEARKLGWSGGGLDKYAVGKCIGGDRFGNNEGLLPKKKGRQYYECDIGTQGKSSRGAKRIIYSDDGLIYYTDDHYESFTLLYGEE